MASVPGISSDQVCSPAKDRLVQMVIAAMVQQPEIMDWLSNEARRPGTLCFCRSDQEKPVEELGVQLPVANSETPSFPGGATKALPRVSRFELCRID